jgi:putative transposase
METSMQRAHKIRLNPTPQQAEYLRKACGTARFVFNWGLSEWERQRNGGGKPSAYLLKKHFNAIKREQFPWVLDVSKCAVDTGFRNLDAAFRNFFRRCKNGDAKKGYPRFKRRKDGFGLFRMDGERVRAEGHWLKLEPLAMPINMTEPLRFNGKIASVTVSEKYGRWYAAFNIEITPPPHEGHLKDSVGVDLWLKALATLSDGKPYENPIWLRSDLRKVRRLNRERSRRHKGSGRWKCTRTKLAKRYQRRTNQRLDYLHKMTTEIASTYRMIGVEDVNVAGMLRNHRLALSIADASFGESQRQ